MGRARDLLIKRITLFFPLLTNISLTLYKSQVRSVDDVECYHYLVSDHYLAG